ncbi:DUF5819 family protein [Halocola ammonii]
MKKSSSEKRIWFYRLLTLGAGGFFVLHFVLITVFCLPHEWINPKAYHISQQYSLPLFYQGWELFAPNIKTTEPTIHYRHWNEESGWSDWVSPYELKGRTSKPLFYVPKKMTTKVQSDFSKRLYYEDGEPKFDAVMNTRRFFHIWRYIAQHHKLESDGARADSLQLKFHFRKIAPPGEEGDERTFVLPAISTNP